MKRMVLRAALAVTFGAAMSAHGLAALQNCAAFITSAARDAPMTGWLLGEKTVSTSKTFSWSYMNFGGAFNGSSTMTQSYSVGTYRMSDGTTQQLRCDGYMAV